MSIKQEKRQKRHNKIRKRIIGQKDKPRLCVFRSNKHIYAQLVNDEKGQIIASASDLKTKGKKVGEMIAEKAKENKISKAAFDRGGYKYHGQVKALADGARQAGLKF